MKRKQLTDADIINWWLQKYHNTTIAEIHVLHPDWGGEGWDSRTFYNAYKVTQEQHDEWHKWMLTELQKYFRCSKKYVERHSWVIYLNTSPTVAK